MSVLEPVMCAMLTWCSKCNLAGPGGPYSRSALEGVNVMPTPGTRLTDWHNYSVHAA